MKSRNRARTLFVLSCPSLLTSLLRRSAFKFWISAEAEEEEEEEVVGEGLETRREGDAARALPAISRLLHYSDLSREEYQVEF